MMKYFKINNYVGPGYAGDRGRLNVANALRYVGSISPLNCTSKLSQQTVFSTGPVTEVKGADIWSKQ